MSQNIDEYKQNYYSKPPANYEEDYYDTEPEDFQNNHGDSRDLEIPDARLYPEGIEDMTDVYAENLQYYDCPYTVEASNVSYRHPTNGMPAEYFYDHHQHSVPSTNYQQQPKAYCSYPDYYTQYPGYSENVDTLLMRSQGQNAYEETCNYHQANNGHCPKIHRQNRIRPRAYSNCPNYKKVPVEGNNLYNDYGFERGDKGVRTVINKKHPVTVKTPKYVTKNVVPNVISKRPSVLCLPVVTQPDPALIKRKTKSIQHEKKNLSQAKYHVQSDTYSAHKMHSQGDVKTQFSPERFERFLDNYENNIAQDQEDPFEVDLKNADQANFKEFAKFLKPRVPSSIKLKQEKLAHTKSKTLQPRLKLSLDKLLNRLQQCENAGESTSETSCKAEMEKKDDKSDNDIKEKTSGSFNYDTIASKCSPAKQAQNESVETVLAPAKVEHINTLFGALEKKRSAKLIRPLDDHCALDLHRSKSYIVDLIDRALSKELGTIPRDQSIYRHLTPGKAISAISRHRQLNQKELCYEVTATLTDSIISNASAPPNPQCSQIVERSGNQADIKEKSGEDTYIKQLKQLRWGHIRHIQHEARKLADLEEFLEKCGEIDY